MKKRFYYLLLTFFALSCSKEEADMDGDKNKETENKDIKIILEAETSSQNIFAPIVFYQSFDFGKDAPCLSEVYDSIVWKSSHSPNSLKYSVIQIMPDMWKQHFSNGHMFIIHPAHTRLIC